MCPNLLTNAISTKNAEMIKYVMNNLVYEYKDLRNNEYLYELDDKMFTYIILYCKRQINFDLIGLDISRCKQRINKYYQRIIIIPTDITDIIVDYLI